MSQETINPEESASQLQVNRIPTPRPDKKHPSICWYFFRIPKSTEGIDPPSHLKCYICQKPVKYNNKSSANLSNHAKINHGKKYNEYKNLANNDDVSVISTTKIQTILNLPKVHRFNQKLSDRLFIEWIIMDTQAFLVAEKPSFLSFVSSLTPEFKVPTPFSLN